jgi:hypothetical protein
MACGGLKHSNIDPKQDVNSNFTRRSLTLAFEILDCAKNITCGSNGEKLKVQKC